MQEIMRIQANESQSEGPGHNLILGLADTPQEIEDIQRLRFDVYTSDMNVNFPNAVNGIDKDRFDQWCIHLMVKNQDNDKVVGTYRFLTPEKAIAAGEYYSESEFDLSSIADLRNTLCECGRSCVHPDFRDGSVIMLLLTGLARLMHQYHYRYLLGCASVSVLDNGVAASHVWRIAQKFLEENPDHPHVSPVVAYPLDQLAQTGTVKTPALIKGYLNLGATICGAPAHDMDFHSADFPILMDMQAMPKRYRRHFGIDD